MKCDRMELRDDVILKKMLTWEFLQEDLWELCCEKMSFGQYFHFYSIRLERQPFHLINECA